MDLAPSFSGWRGGPQSIEGDVMSRFSIKQQFHGANVFLTGCSGFIGGLVLESMLRTTDARRVYVLLRPKRGATAQERCAKLLQGPLFHLVRDKPELVAKVIAVPGDLSEPRLGLSAEDEALLASEVDILIHSAADIRLEAPVQETLRANYVGTKRVLELALQLRRLRSAVHVSTAYVNMNKPPGFTVREGIYPLMHGEVEVDGEEIAEELLALNKWDADRRADFYTRHWGFPNTYCLGKHVAEQMVYRMHRSTGLPLAIVRPALVTGVAGLPWPGYIGNYAGPSGMGAAVAIGFFPAVSAHAVHPYSVWDAVPGDLVASAIMATAAAVGAGASRDLAIASGSGAWLSPRRHSGRRAEAGAVAAAAARGGAKGAARSGKGRSGADSPAASTFTDDTALVMCHSPTRRGGAGGASSPGGSSGGSPVQGASGAGGGGAGLSPRGAGDASDTTWGTDTADDGELSEPHSDDPLAPHPLACSRPQPQLPPGGRPGAPESAPGAARRLFPAESPGPFCPAPPGEPSGAPAAPAAGGRSSWSAPMLIVHAATSTMYPTAVYESYNNAVDFFSAYPYNRGLLVGGTRSLRHMAPEWRPSARLVTLYKIYNWFKVAAVCFLLRLFGLGRAAQKLAVGYQQWAMNNDFKYDTQLLFSCAALRQLHSRIEPSERRDYLLKFGPPRRSGSGGTGGGGAEEEEFEHPVAHLGWRQYMFNCLAGIMRMLTGHNLPPRAPVPGRPGQYIEHQYLHIK